MKQDKLYYNKKKRRKHQPKEKHSASIFVMNYVHPVTSILTLIPVQQARYLSVGMRLECAYRGILRSFIVKGIVGPETPDRSSIINRLENLSLSSTAATNPSTGTLPVVFCMSRATTISF